MHLPKETFEQYLEWVYGRGKKEKKEANNRKGYSATVADSVPCKKSSGTITECKSVKEDSMSSDHTLHTKSVEHSVSRWITGPVASKPTPKYTGSKVLGVAVLHKSCMQPVFSQEEAIDIAKMRR